MICLLQLRSINSISGTVGIAAIPEIAEASQTLYRVQIGAFANRANAEAMVQRAKAAGFEAVITTE